MPTRPMGYPSEGAPITKEQSLEPFAPKGDFKNLNGKPLGGVQGAPEAEGGPEKALSAFASLRSGKRESSLVSEGKTSIPTATTRNTGNQDSPA